MTEELEVLKLVTRRLESAGIPYMVTGSMAMNYYAVPRMTRDIDLVIEVSTGDADRVSDLFRTDFYVDPEAVRRAVAERSTVNVIHDAFVIKVDLLVRKDTPYRLAEFARRRRVTVEGDGFFIVAPEDLVISARGRGRGEMTDTPPDVERRYRLMLLGRSGEERLRMGASMHATAQALVRASVMARNPAASPADVRRALFVRFYGADFDPEARQRILVRLAGVARRPPPPGLPAPP